MDMKEKNYRDFIKKIQKAHGMAVNTVGNCKYLKYVIGRGNNSVLIRAALK